MTSFKTDTQKLMFLVMLVVADSTRAKVLTLPTARRETVSSRQHGDLPAATSGTALRTVLDLNENDRLTSHPTGTEDRLISHVLDDRKRGFGELTDTDPARRNGKDLNENDRLISHLLDDRKRGFGELTDTDPAPRNGKDLNENDRLISHLLDDRKRGFGELTDTDPAPRNGKDLNENDRLTSHVTDDQKRHSFTPDPNVLNEGKG